jgi:hypothetical protein
VFVFFVMEKSVLWVWVLFVVCFCSTSDILRYRNSAYMFFLLLVVIGERGGFCFGAGFSQPLSLLKKLKESEQICCDSSKRRMKLSKTGIQEQC